MRLAIDDNRRAIEEAATLAAAGADGSSASLIIVAGGIPDGSRALARARGRLEEAIAEANARGSGVASLNGKMIDKPVVTRAKRLLELYEAGSKADEVEEL